MNEFIPASISLHNIASKRYDIANKMLRDFRAPPMRKRSGFPYFTKLSTYTPPGTKSVPKRKPVRVNKLTAGEIDMLLE